MNRTLSRRTFLRVVLPGLLSSCVTRLAKVSSVATPTAPFHPIEVAPASPDYPAPSRTQKPSLSTLLSPATTSDPPTCEDKAPVIGIVAHHLYSSSGASQIDGQLKSYRRAVARAGGAPILIPLELREELWRAIYEVLMGIIFPGGVDIDPVHYGEAPHPNLGQVDPTLDQAELMLGRWALADNLPLLGICRGAQLLNVAAGGSLVQDIPTQWREPLDHTASAVDAHMITIRPGTRLVDILGKTECMTNSRHHQAVKNLPDGFVASAYTSDGVIEAIERTSAPFCIGVQWHPENLVDHDPVMQRLFEAFIVAAKQQGCMVP